MSKIKTVIFHHPGNRTEVIEEWLDTESNTKKMNGSSEKLTIVLTKEMSDILNSITDDDYNKWRKKRGDA